MGFQYESDKHQLEHRYAKVGLLLSCVPLLCAMLGLPLMLEKNYSGFTDELVSIAPSSRAIDNLLHKDVLVPEAWLKGKNPQHGACEYEPPAEQREGGRIKFVRVIGERHSGLDGIVDLLTKMFPNVTVGTGFARGKHWFQSERLLHTNEKVDLSHVLVVVVLRNPFEWLRAMRKTPLHSPNHLYRHDWRTFLTKSWKVATSSVDKEISKVPGVKCQAKFLAGEVLPCRQSRFNSLGHMNSRQRRSMSPVYEMNPINKLPLRNVMDLRKHKLLNYANMTTWVPQISFVRIENLFTALGIEKLKSVLAERYNLGVCKTFDHKPLTFSDPILKHPVSTIQEIDFINCNLDWAAENLFGYRKELADVEADPEQTTNQPCSADPFGVRFTGRTFPSP